MCWSLLCGSVGTLANAGAELGSFLGGDPAETDPVSWPAGDWELELRAQWSCILWSWDGWCLCGTHHAAAWGGGPPGKDGVVSAIVGPGDWQGQGLFSPVAYHLLDNPPSPRAARLRWGV